MKTAQSAWSMDSQISKRFFIFCFAISLIALGFSLSHQLLFSAPPCRLCIWQRVLHSIVLAVAAGGIFTHHKAFLCGLITAFFLLLLVSGYHFFIQAGFVKDTCVIPVIKNIQEFKNTLLHPPLPCSKISLSLFGVPLSLVNTGLSIFFLSWGRLVGLKQSRQNQSISTP